MKVFIAYASGDRDLVANLVTLLRKDGHEVLIPSEMAAGANLLSAISAGIRSADILVAVIAAGNANVFYELGLAAGASVPTLVASRGTEPLPADLASVPYVLLTGEVLRDAAMIARRMKDLEGLSTPKPGKFKTAEAALRAAVRNPALLEALSPGDFERLVVELFKERGFEVTETRETRDTGVDFTIRSREKDQLVLVEVKKLSRQGRVSVEAVRQLLGTVSGLGGSLGVLVAASGFTAAAFGLAAGAPILLRTLDDLLAAKSEEELLESKEEG